jgi:hypothetical protein
MLPNGYHDSGFPNFISVCALLPATYLQTILPLELKVSAYFYLFEPIDMTRCPFLECVY